MQKKTCRGFFTSFCVLFTKLNIIVYNLQEICYNKNNKPKIESWNSVINCNKTAVTNSTDYEHNTSGAILGVTTRDFGNGKRDIILYYNNIISFSKGKGYNLEQFKSVWKDNLSHEMGHTLSLNHANDAIQDSLMAYNRDLTDFDPPADVDIAAIKKSYSTK